MSEQNNVWMELMEDSDKFFKQLGQRIAKRRKELGLTQTELGDIIRVSQTVIASYEIARRRIPVSRIPGMAKALAMSIEQLLGSENGSSKKRGPAPKLQRQLEQISQLPKTKQKFVSELLDTVLQKASY